MLKTMLLAAALLAVPLEAQEQPRPAALSPNEIVAAAPKADWVAIAASDLLVMDLAADARGKPRRVVIQLMPPPFSQGWIGNIRKLAAAKWWDGLSVNRVQDNYVVQWGDASEKKPVPSDLAVVPQSEYDVQISKTWRFNIDVEDAAWSHGNGPPTDGGTVCGGAADSLVCDYIFTGRFGGGDPHAYATKNFSGWPVATDALRMWPVHCYGMVGVGRGMPPSTGSGAELYTVIGHAPRHLDRNIALVGRVIEGIEHLSSLPRGTGPLGFYETPEERTGIKGIRLGGEMAGLPAYEYLATESPSFARYADARANRRDPFFIRPAGGADICNIPVPVRRVK